MVCRSGKHITQKLQRNAFKVGCNWMDIVVLRQNFFEA